MSGPAADPRGAEVQRLRAELAEALRERSRQCMKLASPSGMGRMHGKAAAYAHAAELVEAQS